MIIKLIITFDYNDFDYLLIRLHFAQLYFRADFSEFGLSVVIQVFRCRFAYSVIVNSVIICILPCYVCIAFDGLAYVRRIYTDTIAIFKYYVHIKHIGNSLCRCERSAVRISCHIMQYGNVQYAKKYLGFK